MSAETLPAGGPFARRVISLSYAFSMPALVVVMGCLTALLELTAEQWRFFFVTTAVYGAVICFPMMQMQQRMMRPLREYLDRRQSGEPSHAERRAAFAAVLDLPRQVAFLGAGGWLVPVLLISALMALRFPSQWGVFQSFVLVLAGVARASWREAS